MITSWVLVITILYSHSAGMTIIPNLKDLKECQRIQKVMEDRTNINHTAFCMETVNK